MRDADAGILNGNRHCIFSLAQIHPQVSAFGHGLNGILDQVDDHLLDLGCIVVHQHRRGRDVLDDGDAAFAGQVVGEAQGGGDGGPEVLQLHFRRGLPGKLQQIGDDGVGPPGVVADGREVLARLGVEFGVVTQFVGHANDDRQRILHVVHNPGGELADGGQLFRLDELLLHGLQFSISLGQLFIALHGFSVQAGGLGGALAQFQSHHVERVRQFADLVCLLQANALLQVAGGHGLRDGA